ncbi:MAG TPA: PilZ domain-containing protein [Pyrinomonadaceae bacterium]|nr:PilZ domain-containing protein [Pyrinomonadaceae bacterium]
MTEERRATGRVEVDTAIYILWGESEDDLHSGKVTNLGASGCFIQTRAEMSVGRHVFVRLRLPTERWLLLRGEVIHLIRRVGFGVEFKGLDEEDEGMIGLLVEFYSEEETVISGVVCEPEIQRGARRDSHKV